MSLKFEIKLDDFVGELKEFAQEIEQDMQKGIQRLAASTYGHVKEQAAAKLHTSYKAFVDNLTFEEIAPSVFMISVLEDGLWVEEGIEKNKDMKPDLLQGKSHAVIPFDYSKSPSQVDAGTKGAIREIDRQLRGISNKRAKDGLSNITRTKIEYNDSGSPKIGKLHEFDFGGRTPGKGSTPQLKGLSIYQSLTSTGNVRRDVMTFRTVTNGPASQGKWIYPGIEGKKFLDEALTWAQKEWDEKIYPDILSKWK
jgi:hypothetical protein